MQVIHVGKALADNITSGLADLLNHDAFIDSQAKLDDIEKRLQTEHLDQYLRIHLSTKMLRHLRRGKNIDPQSVVTLFESLEVAPHLENVTMLFAEMARIAQDITDTQGIEIAVDGMPFLSMRGDSILPVEQLRLAKLSDSLFMIEHMIIPSLASIDNDSPKYQNLMIEIVQFVRQRDYQPVPEYLALNQLKKLIQGQGYLSMALAAAMIGLAQDIGDQEMVDFIYHYYASHMTDLHAPMFVNLAIELIKVARVKGDWYVLGYFVDYLLNRLRRKREVPVELVIEVTNLLQEKMICNFLLNLLQIICKR